MDYATAERLHSHLSFVIEWTRQLQAELDPLVFPKVPAGEVGLEWEIHQDGAWHTVVTRSGNDGTLFFVCVKATVTAERDELLIARPIR